MSDRGIGTAVKNSLEIVIVQVHLEGGFKRGGRIRVFEANCSKQMDRHKKEERSISGF